MSLSYSLFINGKFVEAKFKQKIINPANQEVISEVSLAGNAEVELALSSARAAFDAGEWLRISLSERKGFLLKIAQGILDNVAELAKLETLNTGKPIKETTFMDLPAAAKVFEYFADNLERFSQTEEVKLENAQGYLMREPYGVAVLIVPWNYPLLIACWKLAQALACGNTVILKPSSLTPLTVLELAKIIEKAELPAGVVNIINGAREAIGESLCSDKRVNLISFTGSLEAGKKIIGYSSWNVKKLIMELGGKSAGIILKDADLETAVSGALSSIFLNQGQMCTAMSRIFVEDDIYDKFIADFTHRAKKIKLGDGLNYETQMGPLASLGQREKVIACVEKAVKEGAQLLCGGKIPEGPVLKNGFFFEPAVLAGVTNRMSIFREEVFGPVVCIMKFSAAEEVLALVNDSDFALAASLWTKDSARAESLAARIDAGTVWVNTYGMFYDALPYGGFKQSGFGKELGKEGFREYSRLKNVITDNSPEGKPLVSYWYG